MGVVCPKMISMQIDRQTERERELRSLASEVIEDLNKNRGGNPQDEGRKDKNEYRSSYAERERERAS